MARETILTGHRDDRVPLQTEEDLGKARKRVAELLQAEQRVEGIVSMCTLDDALEGLLRAVMIDDKSVDALMADGQALQPFRIKLRLAYALGLIPEAVRKDLYYLNKIRNEFAHEADVTSFDQAPVCDWCKELSTAKQRDGTAASSRSAYGLAVIDSMLYLDYELHRRAKEKESRQSQPDDSIEARYVAYRDEWNRLLK